MSVDRTFGQETPLEELVEVTISGEARQLPRVVAEGILKRRNEITARRERFGNGGTKAPAKRTRRRRRKSSRASERGSWGSVHTRPARGCVRLFG